MIIDDGGIGNPKTPCFRGKDNPLFKTIWKGVVDMGITLAEAVAAVFGIWLVAELVRILFLGW